MCLPGTLGGQKRELDTFELELWMAVSCYLGPGTLTWVFWRSSQGLAIEPSPLRDDIVGLLVFSILNHILSNIFP